MERSITYDANGNRNNGSYVVGPENQISSDANNTYTYDDNGNLSQSTAKSNGSYWSYTYDNLNEMTVAAQYTSGWALIQKEAFKYDAFGNRIEKQVDSDGDGVYETTQQYALDGWNPALVGQLGTANWNVWADLNGSGSLTTRYLRGGAVDQLFARTDSGTAYWELTDSQGSIRTVVDNSANVKDQITYDGWGNAGQTNSSYGGQYLYTGREFDVETGLQYNRARYYDPNAGRWISQDPLGFSGAAGDSNLYRYVSNAPVSLKDPTGLASATNIDVNEMFLRPWIQQLQKKYTQLTVPPLGKQFGNWLKGAAANLVGAPSALVLYVALWDALIENINPHVTVKVSVSTKDDPILGIQIVDWEGGKQKNSDVGLTILTGETSRVLRLPFSIFHKVEIIKWTMNFLSTDRSINNKNRPPIASLNMGMDMDLEVFGIGGLKHSGIWHKVSLQ